MREIFFNSFKERILRGDVPAEFELSGAPVTSKFFEAYDNSEISIEQYRTLDDFDTYHTGNSAVPSLSATLFEYSSFGVEYRSYEPDDLSEKPLFVNSANSAEFFKLYDFDISPSTREFIMDTISDSGGLNYNCGFYYALKKTHLNWLAKRCNDEYDFNNQIRIVLGDDIGNLNDPDILESMFCPTPDRPFQGVLDLNCHKIVNKTFICNNNSNGLIGYLGKRGVVRNGIVEGIRMICQNKISIDKIKNDCSDVVCGFLVGTNYGTVENIVTSGEMQFDGFCPEVYLVNNKYEYEDGTETYKNSAYNCFFPNKFCLNSVYNVLPYVGYFCEGADSFYYDLGNPSFLNINDAVQDNCLGSLGYIMRDGYDEFGEDHFHNFNHFCECKSSIHDGFDQMWAHPSQDIPKLSHMDRNRLDHYSTQAGKENSLNWIYGDVLYTAHSDGDFGGDKQTESFPPLISTETNVALLDTMSMNTIDALGKWKSFDEKGEYNMGKLADKGMGFRYVNRAAYLCRQIRDTLMSFYRSKSEQWVTRERITPHQRLNPNARIAYYCSPIVGNNFGTIKNIDCKHVIKESNTTFVGFIGNVCGKQNCGTLSMINTTLDIIPNSACNLNHRTYTKTKGYAPDYPDDWGNLYSVFGYNWDYYQSPYGIPEEDSGYSAHSADCVRVTQSYYDFNDFLCSGYPQGVNPPAFNRYIFNRYANKDEIYGNCNFPLPGSSAETIGCEIPDAIRSAKLKFKYDTTNAPDGFYISFNPNSATYYGKIKFYDPYNREKRANYEAPLKLDSNQLGFLAASLNCDVQHFDLNYLGDAAKTTVRTDTIGGLKEDNKTSDGEKHKLTCDEVLDYSPAFNGPLGSTQDGAYKFCRNIMNAKIAMGAELLANSAANVSADFDWQNKPFVDNKCPFGTTNSDDDYDSRYDSGYFIIPSATGPNDTDKNWDIFDDKDNGPDMCWYMPPAKNKYGEDGPESYNTDIRYYEGSKINYDENKINQFCSIHPEGKWDILANLENIHQDFHDNIAPSIQRSMITIIPRQTEELKNQLMNSGIVFIASTNILEYYGVTGDNPTPKIKAFFGDDFEVRLEEIKIPLMNRKQNKNYQSSSFEGVSNVSGVYIHAEKCDKKWYIEDNQIKYKSRLWNVVRGNLDIMYVSLSLVSNKDGRKRVYPISLELPLDDLFIPISCISGGEVYEETCSECTIDFANMQTLEDPYDKIKVRDTSYYPLVPAYNVEDTNFQLSDYPLKSIYNIGAVAGMINHSESHIQNGGHFAEIYDSSGNRYPNAGYNFATCGKIEAVVANYTDRAMDFIDGLTSCSSGVSYEEDHSPEYDRTIAVANKFSLIAPIYEYHMNEMGPSFESDIGFYSDSLQRVNGEAQVTQFNNIELIGTPNWPLTRATTKSFSPFIEFANISMVQDYTNFFERRVFTEWDRDLKSFYIPFQDTNFPEMMQILWNTSSRTAKNSYENRLLFGGGGCGMLYKSWPAYSMVDYAPTDPDEQQDYEHMLHSTDLDSLESVLRNSDTSHKHYEYVPNFLIRPWHIVTSESGTERVKPVAIPYIGMSPASNFANSEYNDIFMQLLSGSPNFTFSRLCKPTVNVWVKDRWEKDPSETLEPFAGIEAIYAYLINDGIPSFYRNRLELTAADKYFTWDYDLSPVANYPLSFTVQYANVSGIRGLWMHQNIREVDREGSIVRYWMDSACFNDGSNVALGYMPSNDSLVGIMNTRETALFDEGVCVSGDDFQGIVLFDDQRRLVAAFDAQNSSDLKNEAYIFELPRKTVHDDGRGFGLLTRIEAE